MWARTHERTEVRIAQRLDFVAVMPSSGELVLPLPPDALLIEPASDLADEVSMKILTPCPVLRLGAVAGVEGKGDSEGIRDATRFAVLLV